MVDFYYVITMRYDDYNDKNFYIALP